MLLYHYKYQLQLECYLFFIAADPEVKMLKVSGIKKNCKKKVTNNQRAEVKCLFVTQI